MKKYMAIALAVSLAFSVGCGKDEKDGDISEASTETTTEYADEAGSDVEEAEEKTETDEAEELTQADEKSGQDADEGSEEKPDDGKDASRKSTDFGDSAAYKALDSLAKSAGFELSYDGNIATITAYIDDDSALRINSNDSEFETEWNDRCGLYDEFCSEAVRTLKNNNAENITIHLDVVSKTDNSLYYRNENGHGVYNAYNN